MAPSNGSERPPRFSAVIAAHNEAGSLGDIIEGVRQRLPQPHEIIVVDDGSTDGTGDVAAAAGVKTLRNEKNLGKGAALRRGMQEAAGDYLVFIDADGQDLPSDLPNLLREIDAGADFVNGSKFIGEVRKGGISFPNYLGNLFITAAVNLLFGSRITDTQSGFRIIDRKKALSCRYRATEYEIETEMLMKALKNGWKVVEAPVIREMRAYGKTDFRRIRNGLRILFFILRERFGRS